MSRRFVVEEEEEGGKNGEILNLERTRSAKGGGGLKRWNWLSLSPPSSLPAWIRSFRRSSWGRELGGAGFYRFREIARNNDPCEMSANWQRSNERIIGR